MWKKGVVEYRTYTYAVDAIQRESKVNAIKKKERDELVRKKRHLYTYLVHAITILTNIQCNQTIEEAKNMQVRLGGCQLGKF